MLIQMHIMSHNIHGNINNYAQSYEHQNDALIILKSI